MQPTKVVFRIPIFPFVQVNNTNKPSSNIPQNIPTHSTRHVSVLKTIPENLQNQRLTVSYAVSNKLNIVKGNTPWIIRMNNRLISYEEDPKEL